jgi:hypothetical protein
MAETLNIEFQRYRPAEWEWTHTSPTPGMLAKTIHAMEQEESATLEIQSGNRLLIVGVSGGIFYVTALLGNDDFYDLVGDVSVMDKVMLIVGGQETAVPQRYLVQQSQAQEVALEFLQTETVRIDYGWDRQGPDSAWEQP